MSNNKFKILLLEDEGNIRKLVATMLEASGYQVIEAATCEQGKTLYQSYMPDLVILDLGLPDKDGKHFLQFVRESAATPIIVLSARSEERDKVEALDLGANDYVTKPCASAELLTRHHNPIRSSHIRQSDTGKKTFKVQDLVVDFEARQVVLKNQEIKLTQTEYNIVAFLAQHCGKMMTYSAIIKAVWGEPPGEATIKKLQVNMANIRKKLGSRPGVSSYIMNELGVGYRMNGERDHD